MELTIDDYTIIPNKISNKRYGVSEAKKAELDRLTDQVLDATLLVEQDQAAVTALTSKLEKFKDYFTTADNNRTVARNNWDTIKDVRENVKSLRQITQTSLGETAVSNERMEKLAFQIKTVVEELIFVVESINKLSNLIVRKKTKNPLISDELISVVGTTGTDANNAVALMLTALQSTFTAHATAMESDEVSALSYYQSIILDEVISGKDSKGKLTEKAYKKSLVGLLNTAYTKAKKVYDKYQLAVNITTNQLDAAQAKLDKAETRLLSLQSGLAAANAAALAS